MNTPEFWGDSLSVYQRITPPDVEHHLWSYAPKQGHIVDGDLDTTNKLREQGLEPVTKTDEMERSFLLACLFSQLFDIVDVRDGETFTAWTHSDNIKRIKEHPVLLAFTLDPQPEEDHVSMLQFLPVPELGEYAIVDQQYPIIYHISELGARARELHDRIGNAIKGLASPGHWDSFTPFHTYCVSEPKYSELQSRLTSKTIYARGRSRQKAIDDLQQLQKAHSDVVALRQSWFRSDWLAIWTEVQQMVEELADEFAQHDKKKRKQNTKLEPLTSSHKTMIPSNNAMRAIEEGFGPALVRQSLGEIAHNMEHHISTPNGSFLRVRGQEDFERVALTQYLNNMIGVEGLKHMLILLDTLLNQTGAKERLIDVHISLRQLLKQMGYADSKADDIGERRKLAHTILYLARTWVTSNETRYEVETGPRGGRRGGKRKRGVEWTPLFVIEKMKASEDGGLDVPDEVKFHLGEDFYNSMFGPGGHFFYLPTLQILSYHAEREQQELCLSFYLTNMMLIAKRFTVHFREMVLQCGLLTEQEITQDNQRLRKALRVIYAIEHLERDGLIKRGAHESLDLVLAVELTSEKCTEDNLAPATLQRIREQYTYLKNAQDLNEKRRKALQHLLQAVTGDAILFSPGPITIQNVERRESQRDKAIARNEQLQIAREGRKIVDASS